MLQANFHHTQSDLLFVPLSRISGCLGLRGLLHARHLKADFTHKQLRVGAHKRVDFSRTCGGADSREFATGHTTAAGAQPRALQALRPRTAHQKRVSIWVGRRALEPERRRVYGLLEPLVVCAPLQACIIACLWCRAPLHALC